MNPDAEEARPSGSFDVDALKDLIQKYFRVYEVEREIRGVPQGEIAAYYVQMEQANFTERFEGLRDEVRKLHPHLLVILQHRLGEDVILVARKPPLTEKGPTVNIVLLILTVLTTTLAGSIFYKPYAGVEGLLRIGNTDVSWLHPLLLGWGFLTFSLPLILILGVHELGHYFVARRHHVRTSLPYFIPVPPVVPIGTFGAFISMKEPIPDRKALFDIGASGPIAGFLLAIPVVVLGMVLTAVYAVQVPPDPEIHLQLDAPGDVASYGHNGTATGAGVEYSAVFVEEGNDRVRVERVTLNLSELYAAGRPDGNWTFQLEPAHLDTVQGVDITIRYPAAENATQNGDFAPKDGYLEASLRREVPPEPSGFVYEFNVPADAANLSAEFRWHMPAPGYARLGDSLLFLGINWVVEQFMPVDENVYTHPTGLAGWVGLLVTGFNLLPAGQLDGGHVARAVLGERMRWAGYASIALMFLLSLRYPGWILMAILIVFLGLQHPPPLNDKSPLDARRRVLAVAVLVLLLVTFVPFPFVEP